MNFMKFMKPSGTSRRVNAALYRPSLPLNDEKKAGAFPGFPSVWEALAAHGVEFPLKLSTFHDPPRVALRKNPRFPRID
jgi:hypothetical protein